MRIHAASSVAPTVTAPWFANSHASCPGRYGSSRSPNSRVPGVLQDKLRQDQYMQVLACDRQTGRHGGVRVHYRPDVRPARQDPQM